MIGVLNVLTGKTPQAPAERAQAFEATILALTEAGGARNEAWWLVDCSAFLEVKNPVQAG